MQGRKQFSSQEAAKIRALLGQKEQAERNQQKALRAALRRMGFYITDFDHTNQGFGVRDFDHLVSNGIVSIV